MKGKNTDPTYKRFQNYWLIRSGCTFFITNAHHNWLVLCSSYKIHKYATVKLVGMHARLSDNSTNSN